MPRCHYARCSALSDSRIGETWINGIESRWKSEQVRSELPFGLRGRRLRCIGRLGKLLRVIETGPRLPWVGSQLELGFIEERESGSGINEASFADGAVKLR